MLEAALSTSPVVTRLLVGALVRPQKHVSRAPPCRRNMLARALCITIPDDRGDESFADDLNMGRGIVSGRVALLLRSTEIRPHRPNDLLPPKRAASPGWDAPRGAPNTWAERNPQRDRPTGRYPGVGARRDSQGARHQIFLSSGESPGVGVTLDLEIFEPGLAARARESPREPGVATRAGTRSASPGVAARFGSG